MAKNNISRIRINEPYVRTTPPGSLDGVETVVKGYVTLDVRLKPGELAPLVTAIEKLHKNRKVALYSENYRSGEFEVAELRLRAKDTGSVGDENAVVDKGLLFTLRRDSISISFALERNPTEKALAESLRKEANAVARRIDGVRRKKTSASKTGMSQGGE